MVCQAQQSSWKSALWDLYRALGRSTTGSDFSVSLPDALAAGHPSLPHRWKDRVILVDHMVPITLVAYSLASDAYEEQLDAWKLVVHRENAASVTMAGKGSRHDRSEILPVSTNWSRAALTSSLSTPFKYSSTDVPLHLSLLSEKSSLSLWNSSWELSMIAYYPVQVFDDIHLFIFLALKLTDCARHSSRCSVNCSMGAFPIFLALLHMLQTGRQKVANQALHSSELWMTDLSSNIFHQPRCR